MINYKGIEKVLASKGINTVGIDFYQIISVWKSWYRGNVDDFHYYTSKLVDGTSCSCERLTMNIPKKICEDFAKLLWSERGKITLDTDVATKRLWSVLDSKKNNFSIIFPQAIEKAFALGTGVLVEYKDNDETIIEYINGDNIIPYKYTNGYVYGFVTVNNFVEEVNDKKKYYSHLIYHEYTDGQYIKVNELYVSDKANDIGKEISFKSKYPDVEDPVVYTTDTPHFQLIKPAIANNFDLDNPLGLSVYANSIDKFKAIDTKYDSFMNEFELGKKRILVDRTAVKTSAVVQADGTISNVSYFDKNDKAYQAINGMENQPVKEIDFSIRYEEHINSINADLNYISASVGLGQNYYDFNQDGVKTATEVMSENSDTYRTKAHHEIVIRDVLYDLVKSVMFLEGINSKSINIEFDDSIIQDDSALIDEGLKLLNAGVISKETFLRDYLNYDDKQVKEELGKLKEENKVVMPESVDFFGTDNKEEVTEEKEVE